MKRQKRQWRRWLPALAAFWIAASLAACNAADTPRGGPQLPSTPAFLSGSGSGSPSPTGALPATVPILPTFAGLTAPGSLATFDAEVAKGL
ncbi:MAG TPA: hypothetical protein VIR57_01750 [Chloroflexota bacterium]